MKRFILIFGIASLLLSIPLCLLADRKGFVNTVVIDPGHGGRDPGAVGRRAKEKDITLAISLKLGQYIRENMEDVEVIFTRETDEFVELYRRAQIANENQADLFISVHCNSSRSPRAHGAETFVMGLHRTQANLEVAKKENAAILYEDDYEETYDGFDPNSPEAHIIFTLYQNAYLEQSLSMASMVQEQFRERARRPDRGVKQAGFLILYQVTMPGILVEAGFLSNSREEEYLMSETGQAHIASAIYRAFRDYKEYQDGLAGARLQSLTANGQSRSMSNLYEKEVNAPSEQSQGVSNQDSSIESSPSQNGTKISFRVQFTSTSEKRPLDAPEFNGLENVDYYFHEGLYKYTVGNEPTLEKAAEMQARVQQNGFKDAFVVAFLEEERISAAEAIRLLKETDNNP